MILGIDTSVRHRQVVVVVGDAGDVVTAVVSNEAASAAALTTALAGVSAERVAVATGPGSYTGVRGGMAAALGFAHSRGLPLHGIGSLLIPAHAPEVGEGRHRVIADAGRAGVFALDVERRGTAVTAVADAVRISLEEALDGAASVLSGDPAVSGTGITNVDITAALAQACVAAVATPALDINGLAAVHVAPPSFATVKPRL